MQLCNNANNMSQEVALKIINPSEQLNWKQTVSSSTFLHSEFGLGTVVGCHWIYCWLIDFICLFIFFKARIFSTTCWWKCEQRLLPKGRRNSHQILQWSIVCCEQENIDLGKFLYISKGEGYNCCHKWHLARRLLHPCGKRQKETMTSAN